MMKLLTAFLLMNVVAINLTAPRKALASGVFDLPAFLEAGKWSAGLEPEIVLSNGTGAGFNFKPRYGATDFLNWQGVIGTGTGARQFRVGGIADFEWFPDYASQPGIATPLFMEYYRLETDGLLSFGAKPLLYKSFNGQGAVYTPFVALPVGWNYKNSKINGFMQVALGSMFKVSNLQNWKFTAEAGFDVKNAYSYISGGVTYFYSGVGRPSKDKPAEEISSR
ncbi:MAG: hypothetical protein AB1540_04870 [Bdellovibrionota bacterium]